MNVLDKSAQKQFKYVQYIYNKGTRCKNCLFKKMHLNPFQLYGKGFKNKVQFEYVPLS